jgi:hypothetical protein
MASHVDPVRYPVKSTFAAGITALLSLYAVFNFYAEPTDQAKAFRDQMQVQERRFEGLKREMPRLAVAGYFSDLGDSPEVFLVAQYEMAPTVLVDNLKQEWVVGNFFKPVDYAAFASAHHLTLVKDSSNGVVLFRRGGQ